MIFCIKIGFSTVFIGSPAQVQAGSVEFIGLAR